MTELGLGRLAAPDDRDQGFLLREVAPRSTRAYRYWWQGGAWLDQLGYPHCVGYAWTHWLEDGPVTQPGLTGDSAYADLLYRQCQEVDEWPGVDYDGTSVRAGAKVLQSRGLISQYRWAWDLETTIDALLEVGPVVVGTNWYSTMFEPGPDRMLEIHPDAQVVGGHAYLLNGVNAAEGFVRTKNSWGRSWGYQGHARMSFDTLARLIAEDGEVCLALER